MGDAASGIQSDVENKTFLGVLQKLTARGPVWLKALGVLVMLLFVGTPYLNMLQQYVENRRVTDKNKEINHQMQNPDYYGSQGQRIAAPADSHQVAASALEPVDAAHLAWHTTQKMENPGFQKLPVDGMNGEIDYSVYPSDGCVLINHVKGDGAIKSDLVRADVTPQSSARSVKPGEPGSFTESAVDRVWRFGVRKVDAVWQEPRPVFPQQAGKEQVQAGCMNPHPGQFQYWNVPVNQCMIQVFRRFADNCTHYQLYNQCNGQWDPAIHWTFCNPQHRW